MTFETRKQEGVLFCFFRREISENRRRPSDISRAALLLKQRSRTQARSKISGDLLAPNQRITARADFSFTKAEFGQTRRLLLRRKQAREGEMECAWPGVAQLPPHHGLARQ